MTNDKPLTLAEIGRSLRPGDSVSYPTTEPAGARILAAFIHSPGLRTGAGITTMWAGMALSLRVSGSTLWISRFTDPHPKPEAIPALEALLAERDSLRAALAKGDS